MRIKSDWSRQEDFSSRFLFFLLAICLVFFLLLCRLWFLQMISSEKFDELSHKNRTRHLPVSAPRGPIYDRDGVLLVGNRPAFSISVMRQDVDDPENLLDRLSLYVDEEPELLYERWKAGRRHPVYRPVSLAHDVDRSVLERVLENSYDLSGILPEVQPTRFFPFGAMASHMFGTLGEVGGEELRSGKYRAGEYLGRSGIEKAYEDYLRGTEGVRRVEVDARGKELRQWELEAPHPGQKIFLTLFKEMQLTTEQAFGEQVGAAVALDVRTGAVLALVNSPRFDPGLFARGIGSKEWKDLISDPMKPLQDRALKGQYPPGSTFKPVVVLAALEAGEASAATVVNCDGSMRLGDREFRCWKKTGHGITNLKKAMRESCDIWFYEVGLLLGIDRISEMARSLGLGEKTGITISGESSGLVPSRSWKKKRYGAPWYRGETLNASIGQGFLLATPLQLGVMTAAIANGGKVMKPVLVQRIEDWSGNVLFQQEPQMVREVPLTPGHVQTVNRAMVAVVNESHGSGWRSRLKKVVVAGKTGTAQVVRLKDEDEGDESGDENIPYKFRDHALFIAYAPADAPEVAVVVIVEHGGGGGRTAAPIAQKMLQAYFDHKQELLAPSDPASEVR